MSMREENGMHVEDAALLALIDGESIAGEDDLRGHLASCEHCAIRLEGLRFVDRRVSGALAELDLTTPWAEMPDALRQAARDAVTPISAPSASPEDAVRLERRRGRLASWRPAVAAAGLVFVLAVGAAAIPGSPVREFMVDSFSALFDDVGPDDAGPSVVAVDPVDGAVRVVVLGATSELRITIRAGETARAAVSARRASFAVEAGEVRVTDARGDLTIELPPGVEAVVEVDGTPVARSLNGMIEVLPGADVVEAAIVLEGSG